MLPEGWHGPFDIGGGVSAKKFHDGRWYEIPAETHAILVGLVEEWDAAHPSPPPRVPSRRQRQAVAIAAVPKPDETVVERKESRLPLFLSAAALVVAFVEPILWRFA